MGEPARQLAKITPLHASDRNARSPSPRPNDDNEPHIFRLDGSHHHQRHHATSTERRVARWLAKNIGFDGALRFVQAAGPRLVIESLKEDLLEWDKGWIVPERFTGPAGFLREQVRYRLQRRV